MSKDKLFVFFIFDNDGPSNIRLIGAKNELEATQYIIESQYYFDECPDQLTTEEYAKQIMDYIHSDDNHHDGDSMAKVVLLGVDISIPGTDRQWTNRPRKTKPKQMRMCLV